jgi:lysophospholipase L1-like esterase
MRSYSPIFLTAVILVTGSTLRAQDFFLHNGDRVVFYGDSITAQRFYTRDVQDFVATRYPNLQVTYHNAGVPGDKVDGGYAGDAIARVDRDVKPWNPTVITVMLGMNDGDYVPPDPKIFAAYESGYETLLGLLRAAAPAARVSLLENTPYDEITHGTEFTGYMATTDQNAQATPALAQGERLPVVETYSQMEQLLQRAKATDSSFASLLVSDRIHPAEPTHWIITEALMKAWHVNPIVSEVTVSGGSHTVSQSLRTEVTGLSGGRNALSWDQLDEALPLPFDFDNALMNFVLRISDLESYDKEVLKVDDLQPGQYRLQIDKMVIGSFSSDELATGINLGTVRTPMWRQARDYDGELSQRSSLESADLILSAGTKVEDKYTAGRILRAGEHDFEERAQTHLRILKHHYTLVRVGQMNEPKS